MRCRLCRYMWRIIEMYAVWACVGCEGMLEGYLGGWLRKNIFKGHSGRCVYCSGVKKPSNHPGGVALIKQKYKRLGCEPIRKHWRYSQTGQTSFWHRRDLIIQNGGRTFIENHKMLICQTFFYARLCSVNGQVIYAILTIQLYSIYTFTFCILNYSCRIKLWLVWFWLRFSLPSTISCFSKKVV